MRVGELEDSVGKEFTSRRNEIAAEAMRLPARLAEPHPGATRPAVPLLDSVHISPEARAVQFGRAPVPAPVPPSATPSPAEIVSVLRHIELAPGSARSAAGVQRLVALVVQASAGFAGTATQGLAREPRATALVQALLANAAPSTPNAMPSETIVALVRELLGSPSEVASPGVTTTTATSRFEQAAVAILIAAAREAAASPGSPLQLRPGELPPALLGMLVAPQPIIRRPKKRRDEEFGEEDFFEDDDEGVDAEPEAANYFTTK